MTTTHKATKPKQFTQFEEWLEAAIKELDTRQMSPEKRMAYEMTIWANALAVRNENKKIEEAEKRAREAEKTETVRNALLKGLAIDLIAEIAGVPVGFVLGVQQKLSNS